MFLILFKVLQTGIVQAFYLEKIDAITHSCYRCAKNQNKLCDSLGARVQVTMGNNHKQVRDLVPVPTQYKTNNREHHNKTKKQHQQDK